MPSVLALQINGHTRQLDAETPSTLEVVVALLKLRPDRVAIEHNGEIVPRSEWAATKIDNGDRLEIVHFVGGGVGPGKGVSSR